MIIEEPKYTHNQESRLGAIFNELTKLKTEEVALLFRMVTGQAPDRPWIQISPQLLNYAKVGFDTLTPRELQVLQEITKGRSNKVAARELQISHRTVEIHRSRIMQKLGVKNVVELCNVYSAIRHDIKLQG